jgi:hypothetical protein
MSSSTDWPEGVEEAPADFTLEEVTNTSDPSGAAATLAASSAPAANDSDNPNVSAAGPQEDAAAAAAAATAAAAAAAAAIAAELAAEESITYATEVTHVARLRNLPWSVRLSQIHAFLQPGGGVVDGGVVVTRGAHCDAFVAFEAKEALDLALAKDDKEKIGKRYIEVEAATPAQFYRARDMVAPRDAHQVSVVCLSGLSVEIGREELKAFVTASGVALVPETDAQSLDPSAELHAGAVGIAGASTSSASSSSSSSSPSGPTFVHNTFLTLSFDTGKPTGSAYLVAVSSEEALRAASLLHGQSIGSHPGAVVAEVTTKGELYTFLALCADRGLGLAGDYGGCLRLRNVAVECASSDIREAVGSDVPIQGIYFGRKFDTRPSGDVIIVFGSEGAAAEAAGRIAANNLCGKPVEAPRPCVQAEALALVGGTHVARTDMETLCVVYMSGVSPRVQPDYVLERFSATGATAKDIFMHVRFDGKPGGDAFVVFPTEEAARAAVASVPTIDFPDKSGVSCVVVQKRMLYDAITRPPPDGSKASAFFSHDYLDIVIRCKGMPFETGEKEMLAFFEGFAPYKVHLYTDKVQGKTLGE